MILAIETFDTCFPKSLLISTSLPSSLKCPRDPLGRPGRFPLARRHRLFASALGNQIPFTPGKQAKHRHHHLIRHILCAVHLDIFFDGDEPDVRFDEIVHDTNRLYWCLCELPVRPEFYEAAGVLHLELRRLAKQGLKGSTCNFSLSPGKKLS